jgi:membrane protein implicated in regulation of membrane protease activity
MRSVLLRAFACLLILGGGAVALTPALGWQVVVALSTIIAVAINAYWRDRQLRRLHREWREAVARERRLTPEEFEQHFGQLPTDGEG